MSIALPPAKTNLCECFSGGCRATFRVFESRTSDRFLRCPRCGSTDVKRYDDREGLITDYAP